LIAAIDNDYREADLAEVDQALLDYATKLTNDPAKVCDADVQVLRQHGLDDRAIHDACSIVSYFAFANRIASGLGVQLEAE